MRENLLELARRWHGVLITIGAITAIHYVGQQGLITPSLALVFTPVIYTAYWGGLWPGLAAALIGALYPFVIMFPLDRSIQIAIALFASAGPTGYLQSKARKWDTINGLRDKAYHADQMVQYLIKNFHTMPKVTLKLNLETIQDLTGDLAVAVELPIVVKEEIEQAIMLRQHEIALELVGKDKPKGEDTRESHRPD